EIVIGTLLNLTDEQHAICQAAGDLHAGSSLKIQAFAGTGQTTTLAAIAESLARRKFLFLVFNRAAADGAERKMPSNVTVRTAHALAFRSVLVLSIQSYAWEETRFLPGP